jgi:hypothetical protein
LFAKTSTSPEDAPMPASQKSIPMPRSSQQPALDRLREFLDTRRRATDPVADLEQFERELHALFAAAEAEAIADELARFDVDLPVVEIDGVPHRQVLRCEETYMTAAGPARVERSLYSTRQAGERAVCAMEIRAGVIGGFWTPLAAKQADWIVAHLTPQEGEDLLAMLGGMKPSKSSLDRLPKDVSARWEKDRLRFEAALRADEPIPKEAVTVAVAGMRAILAGCRLRRPSHPGAVGRTDTPAQPHVGDHGGRAVWRSKVLGAVRRRAFLRHRALAARIRLRSDHPRTRDLNIN